MRNRTIVVIILLVAIALIIWAVQYNRNKDKNNSTNPNLSVSVQNQIQNADGVTTSAHPKDKLVYTLTAENPSDKVIEGYVIEVGIGDVTKVATLTDAQGANYSSGSNSLVWTPLDIPANGQIQKQFTVQVKDTLPAAVTDRVAKVSYNNQVVTNLATGTATPRSGTTGSGVSYQAPKTGIPGWVSFYLASFITFGVFLFRFAYKLGRPTMK